MAKRDLSPEYRAGADAFSTFFEGVRGRMADCLYFSEIASLMSAATLGKTAEFCLGFGEALAVFIEEVATGSVPSSDWSPMRDLEDPDWWREDEPEGASHG
ncbi:MAG: hypothetical protein V4764_02855 [Burkholderia sp.]